MEPAPFALSCKRGF